MVTPLAAVTRTVTVLFPGCSEVFPEITLVAPLPLGVATTATDVVPLATLITVPGVIAFVPFIVKTESVATELELNVFINVTGSTIRPLTVPSSSPVPPSVINMVTC
jgi:hypothetical protein